MNNAIIDDLTWSMLFVPITLLIAVILICVVWVMDVPSEDWECVEWVKETKVRYDKPSRVVIGDSTVKPYYYTEYKCVKEVKIRTINQGDE